MTTGIPYSSKFSWSNIFMIFMNYTEITKILPQKFPYTTLKYRASHFKNDESRKSAKITKIFNHENLELYGSS